MQDITEDDEEWAILLMGLELCEDFDKEIAFNNHSLV